MDNGKVELRQENKLIRQAQIIAYLIYDNWGLGGRPGPLASFGGVWFC
jgi:hypothetical protein